MNYENRPRVSSVLDAGYNHSVSQRPGAQTEPAQTKIAARASRIRVDSARDKQPQTPTAAQSNGPAPGLDAARFELKMPKNAHEKIITDDQHVYTHGQHLSYDMTNNPDGPTARDENEKDAPNTQLRVGDLLYYVDSFGKYEYFLVLQAESDTWTLSGTPAAVGIMIWKTFTSYGYHLVSRDVMKLLARAGSQ